MTPLASDPLAEEAFRHLIERWHDFYLLAGTAAVTLAGLLFVSLSIHIDLLVHESREHLVRLSRGTLLSFMMVLAISLVFLAPGLGSLSLGVELVSFGTIFSGVWVFQTLRRSAEEDPRLTKRHLKRSYRVPLIGYLMVAMVGGFVLAGENDSLMWMVGIICLLLGNAVGTSWELLVRVARVKRDAEAERAAVERSGS